MSLWGVNLNILPLKLPIPQSKERDFDLFGESDQEGHDKGAEAQGSVSGSGNLDVESSFVRMKALHHFGFFLYPQMLVATGLGKTLSGPW